MRPENKICCIIVNYNTPDLIETCLNSLNTQVPCPDTIIVCDNASTDGSSRRIRAWAGRFFPGEREVLEWTAQAGCRKKFSGQAVPPKFVFIQNCINQGFARGNNLGIEWALAQKAYAYIWLLNPDTWLASGALRALMTCADLRPTVGIWGSSVCLARKPAMLQCAGGYHYTSWNSVIRPSFGGTNVSKAVNARVEPALDYIIGASMFIQTRLLDEIGLLCEDYFLFYEELDLCSRAKQAGWALGWCRESRVYHHGGTGFETQAQVAASRLREITYHETLSTFIYTGKFYPRRLPLIMVLRFFGKFFCLLYRRQLFLMGPVLKAGRDFLNGKWNSAS